MITSEYPCQSLKMVSQATSKIFVAVHLILPLLTFTQGLPYMPRLTKQKDTLFRSLG